MKKLNEVLVRLKQDVERSRELTHHLRDGLEVSSLNSLEKLGTKSLIDAHHGTLDSLCSRIGEIQNIIDELGAKSE